MGAAILCAVLPAGLHASSTGGDDSCLAEGKDAICGHFYATVTRLLAAERAQASEADAHTDVTHCFLDIELDPDARIVSGTSTITATSRLAGLTTFTLDLRDNMTVDAVTVGASPAAWTRGGQTVAVTLDRAYSPGESFTVAVRYHGSPLKLGYGSFDWGTHGTGATIIASTFSQPWFAHTWWPCKESLTDKFTLDIWVTVPGWMVVASNGLLVGTDPISGNRLRYRWHEAYPIATYLVSLAATNYVTWTEYYPHPGGSMPVMFYAYPESESMVRSNTFDLVTQISTFSRPDVYGQYPFLSEKYGIAQFPFSGAMEHQTMTSQGSYVWWITPHELAHQWWGDAVTCGTWHDIWLNEGFASFSEALYLEKKPGGTHADYLGRMLARKPASLGGSVYVYDATSLSTIFSGNNVYNKGAWAVHMLRHVLGDDVFFDTLASYRRAYEGGSAITADFKAVAESVSGRDLTWFFNEWIYGVGAPYYRYGWQQEQIGRQHYVRLHIEQYQGPSYGYPVFTMPVDVAVTTASGTTTATLWNDAALQWFLLPAGGAVTSVAFDPDSWILSGACVNVAYVNGPPKLIAVVPAPDAALRRSPGPLRVQLSFSEAITCTPSDFVITGARTGQQTPSIAYDPSTYTVELQIAAATLGGDVFTITAHDSIRSVGALHALDGELVRPCWFPSGDGQPGGDAVFTFSVGAFGDFDLDADVDLTDFAFFQTCFSGPNRAPSLVECRSADADGDDDVDLADFAWFQNCFNGADRPARCG